jgi:hypothetical protein
LLGLPQVSLDLFEPLVLTGRSCRLTPLLADLLLGQALALDLIVVRASGRESRKGKPGKDPDDDPAYEEFTHVSSRLRIVAA